MSSTVSLEEQEKLRAQEKRVVRKVDWILMPILTVTLGLQVSCEPHNCSVLTISTMTKLCWAMPPCSGFSKIST